MLAGRPWPPAFRRATALSLATATPAPAPGARPAPAAPLRALVVMVCYDSADLTRAAVARFPKERDYDVLLVDDGSTDETPAVLAASGLPVVRHPENRGLGAAIKTGLRHAREHAYDVAVIMAGNDKDDPAQVPLLLEPLREGRADYVQGSRYKEGGSSPNLPLARHLLIKAHALLMSVLTGRRATDAINGFRAYRLSVLDDPRMDVWQDWLDRYEFESYLHFNVLRLGYRMEEVAVEKRYPPPARRGRYSHIRPVIDWWVILRPIVLQLLRLKR